tara:strand:- start:19037 stop:19339 length:303 start_codon:yes stop_codon:yes gene_type:complete
MSEYNEDLPWQEPIEDEEMALRIREEERASFAAPIPIGLIDRLDGGRISVGAFVFYARAIALEEVDKKQTSVAIISELLSSKMIVERKNGFELLPPSFWS